jgi:hypothetical protein
VDYNTAGNTAIANNNNSINTGRGVTPGNNNAFNLYGAANETSYLTKAKENISQTNNSNNSGGGIFQGLASR